jgi:hypothetical protein
MKRKNYISDMHILPYRFRIKIIPAGIMMVILSVSFTSCSKNPDPIPPLISFIQEKGYVYQDTVLEAGQKVKVGIRAVTSGVNLTYFSIRFDDGTSKILLDTGMNTTSLVYDLEVIKTNSPVEKWIFLIMDRNRIEQSVQILFTKSDSSKWGKIRTVNDILLGAQENTVTGSFFSLTGNAVMNLQQAFENQPLADIVYYYGQYEGTLASPNEAEAPGFFTGPQGIANWTVKNETRYDTTMITPQEFDMATNDSLILAAYEPTAGKKKGKYVRPGMVFSFRSPVGKLGLLKIQEIVAFPAGTVKFTVKIQE